MPQSHTTDLKPMPHDNKNATKVKQPTISSSARWLQNYKDTKYYLTKQGPNTKPLYPKKLNLGCVQYIVSEMATEKAHFPVHLHFLQIFPYCHAWLIIFH